jgi:hypothetical protein
MSADLAEEAPASVATGGSRYNQLREAVSRSRATRASQRDECFAFIARFVRGLIRFLEVPPDLVRLGPPDDTHHIDSLTVSAASSLAEDGFWKTGIHLKICRQAAGSPSVVVTLVLHTRKTDGCFLLKLLPDAEALRIPDAADADLSPAYELVFQQILDWLQSHA